MFKNPKLLIVYIIMIAIFVITFTVGITVNPNFDIHEFCMGLSSEFLGLIVAVTIVETYIRLRINEREKAKTESDEGQSTQN